MKSFNIGGSEIKCEDQVKLLGVEIDYKLNFDAQITILCQKAAKQLNALQRLSKLIPLNARLLIFKSFIRSNFNYCPIVWHFCSKANTEKLERLQYRALRICFNDYTSSYESLLQKVKLPTLHLGRLRLIATETFKCLHKISPPYIQDLARFKSSSYNSKYDHMVGVPSVRRLPMARTLSGLKLPGCGIASLLISGDVIITRTFRG